VEHWCRMSRRRHHWEFKKTLRDYSLQSFVPPITSIARAVTFIISDSIAYNSSFYLLTQLLTKTYAQQRELRRWKGQFTSAGWRTVSISWNTSRMCWNVGRSESQTSPMLTTSGELVSVRRTDTRPPQPFCNTQKKPQKCRHSTLIYLFICLFNRRSQHVRNFTRR